MINRRSFVKMGSLAAGAASLAHPGDTVLLANTLQATAGQFMLGIFLALTPVYAADVLASPTLTRAFEAGHPVDAEAGGLAADSLAPRRVGERVFPIVQKYATQTVLVSDTAIADAQATLWRALRIVAEPGGAAAFAAILSGAYRPGTGERIAVTQPLLISTAPVDCRQVATVLLTRVVSGPGRRDAPPHLESL